MPAEEVQIEERTQRSPQASLEKNLNNDSHRKENAEASSGDPT
jgi:hypothetical protein